MKTATRALLMAVACVALAACKTKPEPAEPPPPAPPPPAPAPVADDGRYTPEDLDTDSCLRQRQVYFDFDRDNLKPEFQAIIDCHAKYLRDRPSSRVTLEGHADERGTREYNLGLGERRGNTVNGALAAAAGSSSQLTVVSYGEERPTCTESTEDCWSKNRRVEIIYTAR
jgi:peptidoglycan-associated lipoprotein